MKPTILVLLGWGRSGKDTAASTLMAHRPDRFQVIKFSRPMKDTLERLYGLPPGFLDGPGRDEPSVVIKEWKPITWLEVMNLCFIHFRAIDEHIMFRPTEEAIVKCLEQPRTPIVTDLRTRAEMELLQSIEVGFKVRVLPILITRPGVLARPVVDDLVETLALEMGAVPLRNDSTLNVLASRVHSILKEESV